MSFLGVDIGTSFIKGAILQLETRRLEHIQRLPFPAPLPGMRPLLCEFDPTEIVTAVRALIDQLAVHAPDCEGILACSQMHGMILVNARGEPVSNCIIWRDQRALLPHPSGAGSYFDVLSRRIAPEQHRQLGNELKPERPISFLFWLSEMGMLEPGLIPLSIPDYVLGVLCASPPGVEATNAGAYGAFNLETLDWHENVIMQAGLSHLCWPAIRKQGGIVGHLNIGQKSAPCYTPLGDAQCAMLGGLVGPDELSLNIATGAQVSRLTPDLRLGAYQTRPFFDGQFINTFTGIPAGRCLDVLVDLLTELATAGKQVPEAWSFIAEAASHIEDTDLSVDLAFFGNGNTSGGRISNIRADNFTVGHLFAAAFKNMADNFYARAIELWPDKNWKRLVLSGGLACRLGALRQAIQRRFGAPYRLSSFAEDTLLGLLILAAAFTGRARSVDDMREELRASHPDGHGQ